MGGCALLITNVCRGDVWTELAREKKGEKIVLQLVIAILDSLVNRMIYGLSLLSVNNLVSEEWDVQILTIVALAFTVGTKTLKMLSQIQRNVLISIITLKAIFSVGAMSTQKMVWPMPLLMARTAKVVLLSTLATTKHSVHQLRKLVAISVK